MRFHQAYPALLCICLLLSCACPCSGKIDSLVEVYDNVIDEETAEWLHQECVQWKNPDVVTVFPLKRPELHTPIEQILNQILLQIYPTSNPEEPKYYVEFWKRTEWRHILAHADMDEGWERETQATPSQPLKHPEMGHVLSLKIGKLVRGPTVAWNVSKGGELTGVTEMISIPAVQGRLLRFQGNILHGVPRPVDAYWSHAHDVRDSEDYQRSVLLFNTWPIDRKIIDYEVLNSTEVTGGEEGGLEKGSGKLISHTCNKKEDWEPIQVEKFQTPKQSLFQRLLLRYPYKEFLVPLMGDERRRGTIEQVARLHAHQDAPLALKDPRRVFSMLVSSTGQSIPVAEL